MDDIYDNLENYDEVNIVQELRSENKELKTKLEASSLAMDRLQKFILQDFDKMAAEFKKLEMNYSSLLKTARAEIERKTHIIKNLNMEKDIMILNSLQNIRQSKFQVQKEADMRLRNNSDSESVLSKPASKEKSHMPRLPEKRVPSEDKLSSVDTDNITTKAGTERDAKSKIEKSERDAKSKIEKSERDAKSKNQNSEKDAKIKNEESERDSKSKNEESSNSKPKTKALGIANRRKSMPVLSKEYSKYSSDEEYDDSGGTMNEKRYSAKISDRNRMDKERRQYDDKRRDKAFETSHVRYDSYESRESGYRHRNRQLNRERFRKAEDPEHRPRNKWCYSPKRSNRRDDRDLYESNHYRSDYGRGRMVASPVPEKYNRKRSRDRRSNHDRDTHDNYEKKVFEKYERDVFENYEREVLENYERDVHDNVDQNLHHYKENHLIKHKINTDSDEPQSKRLKTSTNEKISDEELLTDANRLISCESPDYVSGDNVSATLPVKEIMDTAATQLEDPRLASKKYMTVKKGDNIMLSTVIGRNIELEIVDTKTWKMVNIPRPLLYSAQQFTEQIVEEIHMDLDNPLSNITTESGEILDWDANDEFTDTARQNRRTDYEIKNKNQPAEIDALQVVNKNAENIEHTKLCLQRYKIPKIQKSRDYITEVKEFRNETIYKSSEERHNNSFRTDKDLQNNVRERKSSQNSLSDVTSDENISIYKDEANISRSLSNREIVQNDLELSDDNVQPLKEITKEKAKNSFLLNKKTEKLKKTHKQKKSKKVCDDTSLDSNVHNNTKLKEKEPVPEDMKSKFSDLFGDNSSLITPEDLQIATSEAHVQDQPQGQLDKYIDAEDTQNAVDLNFDAISKTKSDISENTRTDTNAIKNSNFVTNKSVTSKPNDVLSHKIESSSQESIKSNQLIESSKDSNTNSTKMYIRLKQVNNSEEYDQKCKTQNEIIIRNKRDNTKSAESVVDNIEIDPCKDKDVAVTKKVSLKSSLVGKDKTKKKNEIESKSCQVNTENKKIDLGDDNTLLPLLEVYDVSEQKDTPVPTDKNTEATLIKPEIHLDLNAIDGMNDLLDTNETTKVDKNEKINCNAICDEPDVKTVVISTGFQELVTESIETNLDPKLRKTQNDLITLLRIKEHSLKALATSTPQKECQENLVQGDKIQAVSSCNTTCPTSDNSTVTDTNDNDVPDVRIFVKRRRRVLKNPQ